MPQFQVTVSKPKFLGADRIEPGMSVHIVTQSIANPLTSTEGKQSILNAFMRIYGIDLKSFDALNSFYLDIVRI